MHRYLSKYEWCYRSPVDSTLLNHPFSETSISSTIRAAIILSSKLRLFGRHDEDIELASSLHAQYPSDVLGVISGMPQYAWSRHNNYHHANNGNWEKYRGLSTTLSVDEYAAMTMRSDVCMDTSAASRWLLSPA
jgi:hypothetical protein